jgi:hypothetical protein
MNLIKLKHRYDFGHDWYVQILNIKNYSLLQVSVSWMDQPCSPYIQMSCGNGHLLSILFWAYKFGFDIDLLSRTWRWNHLEKMDEDETELV